MALRSYHIAKGWRLWVQFGLKDWLGKGWATKWTYFQLETPWRSFTLEWLPGCHKTGYWRGRTDKKCRKQHRYPSSS